MSPKFRKLCGLLFATVIPLSMNVGAAPLHAEERPNAVDVITVPIVGTPRTGLRAAPAGAEESRKDLELMQGRWEVISVEIDGQSMPDAKDATVSIAGNRFSVLLKTAGGEERRGMIFTLDPEKTPRAIDFTAEEGPEKGSSSPGIYELEGGSLKICSANPPLTTARPVGFTAKKGSGQAMMILRRSKT